MKIFLDTADLGEIRRAADAALIDGCSILRRLLAHRKTDRRLESYRDVSFRLISV